MLLEDRALQRQRASLERGYLAYGPREPTRPVSEDAALLEEAERLVADHGRLLEACDAHSTYTQRVVRFRHSNILKRFWMAWTGDLG